MPRTIQADGRTFVVPDDATDEEINQIVGPAPAFKPTATLSAAPAPSWLDQAEQDLREGGNRTILGRIGGTMQGRGDKGYSGIESGVSKGAADFAGSPALGAVHAAQGIAEIPSHPLKGLLDTLRGSGEALTIPSAMVSGPVGEAAIESVPSAKYAGKLFDSLKGDLANVSVPLKNSLHPLDEMSKYAEAGAELPLPASKLLTRSQTTFPMEYPEARRFQETLGKLSRAERDSLNGSQGMNLSQLNSGLYDDIHSAASGVGRGEDYANAMREYRQATQLKDLVSGVGKKAAIGGIGAIGAGELYKILKPSR